MDVAISQFYTFTAVYLLRMARKLFRKRDIEKLTCQGPLKSLIWTELDQEFRKHLEFQSHFCVYPLIFHELQLRFLAFQVSSQGLV